ncbi:hypothetical protein [Chloroflexus sp.]|uniref:hypothetical protein n=1 Tax=Chloroflexus sp. TaxID=1904827 RepID=UPI002ACDE6F3|nr:hypothetical protein [Chloroflexus sp.]
MSVSTAGYDFGALQPGELAAVERQSVGGRVYWMQVTVLRQADGQVVTSADNHHPAPRLHLMGEPARARIARELLRQRMLGVIAEASASFGQIAEWDIDSALGGDTGLGVTVGCEADSVLRELVAAGLVEELTDLRHRYRHRLAAFLG